MTEHSPLPWRLDAPTIIDGADGGLVAESWHGVVNREWDECVANAEFIVHCVNLHNELVAALASQVESIYAALVDLGMLRRLISRSRFLETPIDNLSTALEEARAVLAKVKGEAS